MALYGGLCFVVYCTIIMFVFLHVTVWRVIFCSLLYYYYVRVPPWHCMAGYVLGAISTVARTKLGTVDLRE